jgi:hypothetical protein
MQLNLTPYEDVVLSGHKCALDTAATIIIVNDLAMITDVGESEDIVKVKTINGETFETSVCGFFGPFGKAFYCPQAEVNLIPLSPLEKL